jgi:hypothetical protein
MPSVNCCHVLVQPLAKGISSDTAGSVWATDVPGWITAVGTALLAIFAILTTIYAVRAFRKQSQEVSDQASMLQIQSEQLAEQRKVNAEQIRVLALQAAELSESLAERKREAVERRNALASRVSIVVKPVRITPRHTDTGFRLDVTVANASEQQPVYDAQLYWYSNGEPYGTENPELLGTVLAREKESRSRDFLPGSDPDNCGAILTFRDALRVHWIRTADGGMMHADSDLTPDIVKALYGAPGGGAPSPDMAPDVG